MKKIFILGIIILLLLPTFTTAGKKNNERDILLSMLEEINGEYLEDELNIGGLIVEEFLSIENLDEIGDNIKDLLEIYGEEIILKEDTILDGEYFAKEKTSEDNYNQLTIYGYGKMENPITIILASYFSMDNNKGETSLFINMIKREKNFNINGIIEKIENIFKDFGKTTHINICMTGTIDGKFEDRDIDIRVNKAINRANGKIVETYKDEFVQSYTIYTELIEDYIFSMEKRINLNLVIRYNEEEEKTYILIATPIITTGY